MVAQATGIAGLIVGAACIVMLPYWYELVARAPVVPGTIPAPYAVADIIIALVS